jgi:hypothetical protein
MCLITILFWMNMRENVRTRIKCLSHIAFTTGRTAQLISDFIFLVRKPSVLDFFAHSLPDIFIEKEVLLR